MTKEITIDGKTFPYKTEDEDKSLLEFLEESGFKINSECRNGYCGACKCELVSGEVSISDDAIGFTDDKEILTCSSKPKSNITLSTKNF